MDFSFVMIDCCYDWMWTRYIVIIIIIQVVGHILVLYLAGRVFTYCEWILGLRGDCCGIVDCIRIV